jgi:phage terminase large subunit
MAVKKSKAIEELKLLLPILEGWGNDPVQFVRECLGVEPLPWQAEFLTLVANNPRVAVRSGHGVGKTSALSWLIFWYLLTNADCKVGITAPTQDQLRDNLWGELRRWHSQMRQPFRDWITLDADRVTVAEKKNVATARTARKEQPEAFQGLHAPKMLAIVDEASGVENAIFEASMGFLTSKGAKFVLTGNPTQPEGFFYDCFHSNRDMWKTLKVSCLDIEAEHTDMQALSELVGRTYGFDSNAYRVRVLGEFPDASADGVIPLHLVEAAVGRDVETNPKAPIVWGLDVARFGDDRTVLVKRQANRLLEKPIAWIKKDLMQTAGLVKLAFDEAKQRPEEIVVDVIGIGAGVVDRLRELGLPIRGVNVSESPAVQDKYMRLRDELWWRARAWFEARDSQLPKGCDMLVGELASPRYVIASNGKIKVESKDEMKKRAIRSPDEGDAFCLTFASQGSPKAYMKPLVYKIPTKAFV